MGNSDEKLSDVKKLILSMLAGGTWVSSEDLLRATKQKYFDRRIRELRDELGYDIETSHVDGKPHYKLQSQNKKPPAIRTYLTAAEKNDFLAATERKCALCQKSGDIGKSLVFDHRVPLIRFGSGNPDNFQLLCRDCNNQKRTQCRGCEYDCTKCYLAFPETYPKGIIIRPKTHALLTTLEIKASAENTTIEDYIVKFLEISLL